MMGSSKVEIHVVGDRPEEQRRLFSLPNAAAWLKEQWPKALLGVLLVSTVGLYVADTHNLPERSYNGEVTALRDVPAHDVNYIVPWTKGLTMNVKRPQPEVFRVRVSADGGNIQKDFEVDKTTFQRLHIGSPVAMTTLSHRLRTHTVDVKTVTFPGATPSPSRPPRP